MTVDVEVADKNREHQISKPRSRASYEAAVVVALWRFQSLCHIPF